MPFSKLTIDYNNVSLRTFPIETNPRVIPIVESIKMQDSLYNITLQNDQWTTKMAPVYKLKYFNYMGVAEPIKYLLAYGNIQYENIVVPDAEWIKMQKLVPFSKLPILEVDNKAIWSSVAVSQYLAKLVGLWSVDDWEVAELNALAEVVYELGQKVLNWYFEVNEEWKPILWKELEMVIIPKYLSDFEEILKKKGTFFGGKKLSWFDVYFVGILESIELLLNKSLLQKQWPALYQLYLEVRNVPFIKAYISKRPAYKY